MKFSKEFIESLAPFFQDGDEIYTHVDNGDVGKVWDMCYAVINKSHNMSRHLFTEEIVREAAKANENAKNSS